jgi:hypothetical protein
MDPQLRICTRFEADTKHEPTYYFKQLRIFAEPTSPLPLMYNKPQIHVLQMKGSWLRTCKSKSAADPHPT